MCCGRMCAVGRRVTHQVSYRPTPAPSAGRFFGGCGEKCGAMDLSMTSDCRGHPTGSGPTATGSHSHVVASPNVDINSTTAENATSAIPAAGAVAESRL